MRTPIETVAGSTAAGRRAGLEGRVAPRGDLLPDLRRGGDDDRGGVAHRLLPGDRDPGHPVLVRGEGQPGQREQAADRAQVGLDVVREEVGEGREVEEVREAPGLALELGQELLLAGDPGEVRVGVAVAHVGQGVGPVEALVSGLQVDGGVRALRPGIGVVVVVAAVDVDVDAAHLVHQPGEALEVDVQVVVDALPGQGADGLDGLRRAAGRVRRVDLVRAVARDGHVQVAREGQHRDEPAPGVHPHQDERVAAPGVPLPWRPGRLSEPISSSVTGSPGRTASVAAAAALPMGVSGFASRSVRSSSRYEETATPIAAPSHEPDRPQRDARPAPAAAGHAVVGRRGVRRAGGRRRFGRVRGRRRRRRGRAHAASASDAARAAV